MPQGPIDLANVKVIPVAGNAAVVTTGGTAVVAVLGPTVGGFITNPLTAASQGLGSAEELFLDMVTAPGSTDSAANGTTSALQPGQTFTLPALSVGIKVYVNAASSGHKFTVNKW